MDLRQPCVKFKLDIDITKLKKEVLDSVSEWAPSQGKAKLLTMVGQPTLSKKLKKILESTLHEKIDKNFFVVDYKEVKKLNSHIDDKEKINYGNRYICVLPLEGDCNIKFQINENSEPFFNTNFSAGTIAVLDNTTYWHSVDVLSPTRVTLVFWIKDENSIN